MIWTKALKPLKLVEFPQILRYSGKRGVILVSNLKSVMSGDGFVMLDFSLYPYEWQKNMTILIQNENLVKIEFLIDRSITFDFINSYDGNFSNKIICQNVWKFTIENDMEREDEFPFFICDVRIKKLEHLEIEGAFEYLKYGLEIPINNEYTLLCMDSGDISISLICEKVIIGETC